MKRFCFFKGRIEDERFLNPGVLMLFLFCTVILAFFTASCAPDENGGDVLVPEGLNGAEGERELNAINVLTGEAVSFPGDWEGELVYLNFFMAT